MNTFIKYASFCPFLSIVFLIGCVKQKEANDFLGGKVSDKNNFALAWILKGDYKTVQYFYDLPNDVQLVVFPKTTEELKNKLFSLRKSGQLKGESLSSEERWDIVDSWMAEPNEKYNATDQVWDILPARQFIAGGFSKDYAFVFYQVGGGHGYYKAVVVMKRGWGKTRFIFIGISLYNANSLGELLMLIKNERIRETDNPGDM